MDEKYYISTSKKLGKSVEITTKVEFINKKKASNGSSYCEILFKDKTGTSKSNIFSENVDFKTGDIVKINAIYDTKWNNYKINSYVKLNEGEYDKEDIGKEFKSDIEDVLTEINEYIEKIDNQFLKSIIEYFYKDENVVTQLKSLPDSLFGNQKFEGGTLEKHLNVLKNSLSLSEIYKNNISTTINKDLIISSTLLLSISKYLEFKMIEDEYIYTDIGSLIESSKLSLYKVMEVGKGLILEETNKIVKITEEISQIELKMEECIKILNDPTIEKNVENTNDVFEIEDLENKIKDLKDLKHKIAEESKGFNTDLLKLNHIISTQNYYFNEKENISSFPKFVEAQIVSMSVFNNYKLSIFSNEYNNIITTETNENSVYSNKLNKFIYIK
jgi:hypothetical protein